MLDGSPAFQATGNRQVEQTHHQEEFEDQVGAVFLVRCPDDTKLRFGVWLAPDPAPDVPLQEADLTGTPADPQQLEQFISGLRLCAAD